VPGLIAGAVLDLLGHPVQGCLLEDEGGRVVAHALPDASLPRAVERAVLLSSTGPLDAAVTGRRTQGLVASGPVVASRLEGWSFLRAALLDRSGALWLVGRDLDLPLTSVEQVCALSLHVTAPSPLAACLAGNPHAALPPALASCRRWWVSALDVARLPASDRLVVQGCVVDGRPYLVVGATAATCTAQVARLLHGTRAGLSRSWEAPRLDAARRQADLALEVAGPGEVVSVEERRSALVVHHVTKNLATLPDLGDDPLARLAEHDQRRDARLVDTLRCWLTATTGELAIHSNTLRYRLRRIEQITGVDLRHDATARLELQLRLAGQPQLSLGTSSTAS